MQHAQQILDYSTVAVLLLAAIGVYSRTISAYGNTLGNGEFKFKFDKSRLLPCIFAIVALAILSFAYCLLVAQQVAAAAVYSSTMTFFGGLGIFLRFTFIVKHG